MTSKKLRRLFEKKKKKQYSGNLFLRFYFPLIYLAIFNYFGKLISQVMPILCPNNLLSFRPYRSGLPSVFVCIFFLQRVLSDSLNEYAYMLKYNKARYFVNNLILINEISWTQEGPNYVFLCQFKLFFSFSSLILEKWRKQIFQKN